MTYPLKFRQKVLERRAREGLTIWDVSARFCVGIASVVRWLKAPESQTTRDKPATKIDMDALAKDLHRKSATTLMRINTNALPDLAFRNAVSVKHSSASG